MKKQETDKTTTEENETDQEASEAQELPDAAQDPEIEAANEAELDDELDAESEQEDLSVELEKLKGTLLRERADFINYRRRATQEKEDANKRATEKILNNLVPVLDAFDQVFTASKEAKDGSVSNFLEGAALIQKQMWQVFSDLGVSEIDPADEEFNPACMEALSVSESEEVDHEKVGQVYQKGYKLGDRVVRPARVAVIKPTQRSEKVVEPADPENKDTEE